MAITIRDIMMLTNIDLKHKLLQALLIIALLALLHSALVSSLVALNNRTALMLAERVTRSNPDVFEAQAVFNAPRNPSLAFDYWSLASDLRQEWPYYKIGMIESAIQANLKSHIELEDMLMSVIALAPNERGLDRPIAEAGLILWPINNVKLKEAWKARVARLRQPKRFVEFAESADKKSVACAHLPWKRAKRYCR